MLNLESVEQVYLAPGATDLRKSIDELSLARGDVLTFMRIRELRLKIYKLPSYQLRCDSVMRTPHAERVVSGSLPERGHRLKPRSLGATEQPRVERSGTLGHPIHSSGALKGRNNRQTTFLEIT